MNEPRENRTALARLIAGAGLRVRAGDTARAAVMGLSALLQLAALAMLTDAWLDLAAPPRIVASFALLAVGIAAVLRAAEKWRAVPDIHRLARRLEQRAGVAHNALTIGADLAATVDARASAVLRTEALRRADNAAAGVSPWLAVDTRPLLHAGAIMLASLALHAALAVAMPRVHVVSIARFLRPSADHTPYTRLAFEIAANPASPRTGEAVALRVNITAPNAEWVPNRAVLVIESPITDRRPLAPGALSDGNSRWFELRIASLWEPMVGYVETPQGRSGRFNITPVGPIASAEAAKSERAEPDTAAMDRRAEALADNLTEAVRAAKEIDSSDTGGADEIAAALSSSSSEALALARSHPIASAAAKLRAASRASMNLAAAVVAHGRQPLAEPIDELERALRELRSASSSAASASRGHGDASDAAGTASRQSATDTGNASTTTEIEPPGFEVIPRPSSPIRPTSPAEIDAIPVRFRAAARAYFDRLAQPPNQ